MIVGSRQRLNQINSDPGILIGDHMIKRVSNKKFLGVVLDEQLKVAPYTFIIGGLVPNLEFSRENVKNICKNKYNFFSLKSEPQDMFILMF